MAENPKDLPLHDEAVAREKWRGRETITGEGDGDGLAASEGEAEPDGEAEQGSTPRLDLRPPD